MNTHPRWRRYGLHDRRVTACTDRYLLRRVSGAIEYLGIGWRDPDLGAAEADGLAATLAGRRHQRLTHPLAWWWRARRVRR
ncbi:hypothetical protein AB0J47_40015 [Nocardia sp. NPDC049737]|uniref:hypothetical protein n=1 Tax=Nocardia sp. NPDC049737 TaxID=3154358 RepID=UPI00344309E2